jgi:3-dehydroquinate dehydratase
MENITSNIEFKNTKVNLPFPQTPQKPVEKPPIENIITLLEHIVTNRRRKAPLLQKLKLLTDKDMTDLDVIEEIEKVEEDIEFIDKYTGNLLDQAAVIMNEHKVQNIPSLDDIEKKLSLENENI